MKLFLVVFLSFFRLFFSKLKEENSFISYICKLQDMSFLYISLSSLLSGRQFHVEGLLGSSSRMYTYKLVMTGDWAEGYKLTWNAVLSQTSVNPLGNSGDEMGLSSCPNVRQGFVSLHEAVIGHGLPKAVFGKAVRYS